ncbi:ABC transporter permease subunit [Lysinibacillus parviboronicapiens]|uniref:ABC transporter permease subunit n=1 Tax=Lysinibacillus parviboronicapiens TaxID=436516 RepID=UPI000D345865|nr:ABC transporter permease subunit [Lysinibacillus parviboronicapiens]
MNIFMHEIKAYRKSTFVWTLSLIAIVVLFMSMFPAISRDIIEFQKLLEGFPEPVRKALGLEVENFGTILGFYSYMFVYITLCGAIQAMHIGTSIVSKEVRDKTADFLLTKPVSRTKILTAKLLAALTTIVMTNIVFFIGTTIMIAQVQTQSYSTKNFILISLTLFFLQVIFLTLGIIVSIIFPTIKSVLTVSLGTVFSFFIIGLLVSTTGDGGKRYLSPFKYFDQAYIIENASYETSFVLVGMGIVIISLGTSYIIYMKKDI